MNRKHYKLISAIDIGSNYIRMCIAEAFENSDMRIIEDLIKPTNIGRDSFSAGRISVDTINETCKTIKNFSTKLKEYNIKDYLAVSTTGMREAENQEYVIEQIKTKTGIKLKVINSAEERFFMDKALNSIFSNLNFDTNTPTMTVNITSGGVEISIYDKGLIKFNDNIKIGSLRLREELSTLEKVAFDFPVLMEEFIESNIYFLRKQLSNIKINNFIGLGGELSTIHSLCCKNSNEIADISFIKKDELESLYSKIIKMSSAQIIQTFGLSKKQEEILIPSIIFFKIFLEYTKTKGIHIPKISLNHGLLHHMSEELFLGPDSNEFNTEIIKSALYITSKYCIDNKHASHVKMLALSIFDQTMKIHKLDKRARLYLEVASLLHDVGKYISYSEHNIHSYYIIKAQILTGFSNKELDIIANITRYHEGDLPKLSDENYSTLNYNDRIIVSKLAAILQLAEALDLTHKQKISKITITASNEYLNFVLDTKNNILLEEWHFSNFTDLFEEVFGIKPIIKHKG